MEENFFVYQRRALRPLLVWGIGSSLLGALLAPFAGFWRHFGLQAVAWGTIDLLLAIVGRRRALLQAEALASHAIDEHVAGREAAQLRNILRLNVGLDLLYIAGGLVVARRFAQRPDRRGLGIGIAVQGLFLLIYDSLFARDVGRRFVNPDEALT